MPRYAAGALGAEAAMENSMRMRATLALLLLPVLALPVPSAMDAARAQSADKAPPKSRSVDVSPGAPVWKGPVKRAQEKPKPVVPETGPVPQQRRNVADQEYRECLKIWDKGTHMTRAEWAATCRRVQARLNTVTGQADPIPGRRRVR